MELAGVKRTRAWHALCRHPQLCDGVLGLAVVTFALVAMRVGPHGELPRTPDAIDIFAMAVGFLAVAARRLWARAALAVAATIAVLITATDHTQPSVLTAAIIILFFTYASHGDRRRVWAWAGYVAGALYLSAVLWTGDGWWEPEVLGTVAWIGMATAIGDAARSRRAYIAEVVERARRAEQTREEEARRRVVEERVRIARELHDVVAHHIAVIKVQATGAKHILAHRPELVAPALDHISRSSDAVLKEIASVLGLLRGEDEADTEPTRGLARLTGLLDDLAAAGLRVDHRQLGNARELPALADLAAYRIAQEALTNAQKYGDGTARLTVAYTVGGVTLDITNPIRRTGVSTGSGYGIVGMRERATATGGTVTVGTNDHGRFAVHAELPAPAQVLVPAVAS
jgi:signal transduction histidine kinase